MIYKTVSANQQTVNKEWLVVDVTNEVLGRISSKIASILRGKNKPNFTPHVDCGDNVIVINADKIRLTGSKWTDKNIVSYSGYPGGQKILSPKNVHDKNPEKLVEMAVKGMLPKNRLGRAIFKNLHVYAGPEHPHEAQNPKVINLNSIK